MLAALWLPAALMACADTAAAQGRHVGRMFALSGAFLSLWVLAAETALSPPVRGGRAPTPPPAPAPAHGCVSPSPDHHDLPGSVAVAGCPCTAHSDLEGRSLRGLRCPPLQRHPPRRQRPPSPAQARARHVRPGRPPGGVPARHTVPHPQPLRPDATPTHSGPTARGERRCPGRFAAPTPAPTPLSSHVRRPPTPATRTRKRGTAWCPGGGAGMTIPFLRSGRTRRGCAIALHRASRALHGPGAAGAAHTHRWAVERPGRALHGRDAEHGRRGGGSAPAPHRRPRPPSAWPQAARGRSSAHPIPPLPPPSPCFHSRPCHRPSQRVDTSHVWGGGRDTASLLRVPLGMAAALPPARHVPPRDQ